VAEKIDEFSDAENLPNCAGRVYAQTSFYQENLAVCFQLCTVTHFFGFLLLPWFSHLRVQLNKIWRIFCVMYGEEGGWTLFICFQKLYLTNMFCYIKR
jgi:hypothetical protein